MKKLLIIFLIFSVPGIAQRTKLINSGEIITEGIKLYKEKKYDEALEKYNLIDRNDTNYASALVERALTYNRLKNYELSVKLSLEAIEYPMTDIANTYNALGNAYDENTEPEKAIEAYKKSLNYAPHFCLSYFNIALTYYKMEKWDSSIVYAKKAIDNNIFHASSHYLLGFTYYQRQAYAQAMLPLQMFLLLEPASERSVNARDALIDIANINNMEHTTSFDLSDEDKIFDGVNTILKSKVALNENYKTPVKKIKDPLINQMYVLLEKMNRTDDIENFWHRNYTRFFKEIFNQNNFLPFAYSVLSGVNNKKVKAEVTKEKEKIEKFNDWANQLLIEVRQIRYFNFEGKMQQVIALYDRNQIIAVGKKFDNSSKSPVYFGYWETFGMGGSLVASIFFDSIGKKTGIWKYYYPSGKIKEVTEYKNDEVENTTTYYESGIQQSHAKITGSQLDYINTLYFNTGIVNSIETYVNDKKEGEAFYNYFTGERHHDVVYKNDKIINQKEYFFDRKLSYTKIEKEENKFETTDYYKDGTLYSQGNIFNDKKTGVWKRYHKNGKLENLVKYDENGEESDTSYRYNKDGILTEYTVYSKGKKNGICKNYDDDGKLYIETVYKNDDLTSVSFYNKSSELISKTEAKQGKMEYKGLYPTGELKYTGTLVNGKKEGIWKSYGKNGNLEKEESFKNDLENGLIKTYFICGALKEEYYMKDDLYDGYYKLYFANGKIDTEGWFVNDMREGYWYSYNELGDVTDKYYYLHDKFRGYQQDFRINGSLDFESYYNNNLLEKVIFFDTASVCIDTITLNAGAGKGQKFSKDKILLEEFELIHGKYSGEYIKYHTNGQVYSKFNLLRGKRDGAIQQYDINGNLTLSGNYLEGERDGEWKWYENKILTNEGMYKNGEIIKSWKDYYDNGKLKQISEYNDDGEIIIRHQYAETGELIIIKKYEKDQIASYTYQDINGKNVPDIPIINQTGKITAYYKNGKKSTEQEYVNDEYVGKIIKYYPNGNIQSELPLKYDSMNEGLKIEYWPDNKIKSEMPYIYNNLHGECKFYRSNGSLERIESYYMDEKYGECKYFDEKGNLLKTEKYISNVFYK